MNSKTSNQSDIEMVEELIKAGSTEWIQIDSDDIVDKTINKVTEVKAVVETAGEET